MGCGVASVQRDVSRPRPESLSALGARRAEFDDTPTLEKCVSEAVFEQVRERVLPGAPSRLNCLFAAPNLATAMEIWGEYVPAPRFDAEGMGLGGAVPVSTADGRWVAVDLRLFEFRPSSARLSTLTARPTRSNVAHRLASSARVQPERGGETMAFRVRDLLIAVMPVGEDGRLLDFPGAIDECSRCTGLTKDCPGCSRVQCSEHPTRNFGHDFTIYEAVADFQAAERALLRAELKLTAQRNLAAGLPPDDPAASEADLGALEKRLEEALKAVRAEQSATQ
jgi:hypothetical protein